MINSTKRFINLVYDKTYLQFIIQIDFSIHDLLIY